MRKILICMMIFVSSVSFAKDFLDSNKYAIGVYARAGAEMGIGLDFSMPIIKGENWEWRNFIGIDSFAFKLSDKKYDSAVMMFSDKMVLSYLSGSSIVSHIGFSFFRPYVFIGAGFGLMGGKYNNFGQSPYYVEISAGIGHEFISKSGHVFFFEFGGLAMLLTQYHSSYNMQGFSGSTKVLLGYRIYF